MDILYLLIPLSALLVLLIIGIFGWALHGGQFDDLDREGERILNTDGDALTAIKPGESQAPNNSARVDSH